MRRILSLTILVCLLCVSPVFGLWNNEINITNHELTIVKKFPETVRINEEILIEISLENNGENEEILNLRERLPEEVEFDMNRAKYIHIAETNDKIWYYEWELSLKPKEKRTISFSLKPAKLGEIIIYPTEIIISGNRYLASGGVVKVLCAPDNFCDAGIENSLNCPQDCPTGIEDGVCDRAKDNRVDPDCREGVDPDDTSMYEESIAEAHGKSDTIVYGALLVVIAAVLGVVGVYKLLRRK